ncbi:DUF5666 domain-containing protein [Synechococcus elongatus]|uniref:DUF5666 domain-containing protein n=2 Tax=Synechococcus elongatus TaxID=32046 RepID=A0AAN1UVG1_SYNEL|nr:DUF5666 domain-containing protein [Synechococcus elongatus]AZB73630.1 hypothetical protein DOP62_04580 [Synechococcus elongatus PCC 11801]QFZ91785.1 hypothetical protein EKO22_04740 [Synechococcus elongatus PCC 11802]
MKPLLWLAIASLSLLSLPAQAKEDFYGIIQQRPSGTVGTWTIGDRAVTVTDQTELEGNLVVGTCVEVDFDNGRVEEIEVEPLSKCR